jgi:hypothetical protein
MYTVDIGSQTGTRIAASWPRLAALKAAVFVASERARDLAARGRMESAEVAYHTLLVTLHALLHGEESLRGWQRVAALLADLDTRLPLDALAASHTGELQIRVQAMLDLPDLTALAGMDGIHDTIAAAITVGAPRYNAGDIIGCCTAYWATLHTILAAPAARGFPGHARALAQLRPVAEAEIPPLPLDAGGVDRYAWVLRHAFDATLAIKG